MSLSLLALQYVVWKEAFWRENEWAVLPPLGGGSAFDL